MTKEEYNLIEDLIDNAILRAVLEERKKKETHLATVLENYRYQSLQAYEQLTNKLKTYITNE